MVNGAWSGQLEVEFLLQVFTIRQERACTEPDGLGFGLPDLSSSFVRTQRGLTAAGGQKRRFSLWRIKSTAYKAPGAPIDGYPLGTTPPDSRFMRVLMRFMPPPALGSCAWTHRAL